MPEACNFIKKRLQDGCFPVNIAKFLKTTISKNICKRRFFTARKDFYILLQAAISFD